MALPVQVVVIPVGLKHEKACQKLGKELREAGLRVDVFTADQSVGKSIRIAEKQKSPYMLVIGDKEVKSPKLHVRERAPGIAFGISRWRTGQRKTTSRREEVIHC